MRRRRALKLMGLSLGTPVALTAAVQAQSGHMAASPAQTFALAGPDSAPHERDIEKYPRCTYCGMDRRRFHHSRMLIHYGDHSVDPLCSIRCAVNSLSLHLGKMPLAIWVGDNAGTTDPLPLTNAETATFLIGSSIRGVMTRRSKVAYSTTDATQKAMAANGGETGDFDKTLLAAYDDVAESVSRYLKTNAERLKRMGRGSRP